MTFASDLVELCKKHKINIKGQLLVMKAEFPQGVEHKDQAYWGQFPVRDMQAVECNPIYPAPKAVEIKTAKSLHISSDIAGYTCPVTGKWVEGRRAHRDNLKRRGCRLLEPGEKDQFIKDKPKMAEMHAEKAADFLSDRIAERWDA